MRAALISYRSGHALGRRLAARLRDPRRAHGRQRQPHPLRAHRPAVQRRRGARATRSPLRESTLTHFDRLAGWSCAAFNDLLTAALHGDLARRDPGDRPHLRRGGQARQRDPARHAVGRGRGDRELVVRARHAADGALDGAARRRSRARGDGRGQHGQRRHRRGRRDRRPGRRRVRRSRASPTAGSTRSPCATASPPWPTGSPDSPRRAEVPTRRQRSRGLRSVRSLCSLRSCFWA